MNHTSPTPHSRSHLRFWIAGILGFFIFLYLIRGILLPFVVGLLAAYFLDPAVRKLRQKGLSRGSSAAIITVLFFIIAVMLCATLIPLLMHQLTDLATELPGYVRMLQEKYGPELQHYADRLSPEQIESFKTAAGNIGSSVAEMLGQVVPSMLKSSLAILNMLSLIFLTPVVVFYLLRDWNHFVVKVDNMLPRQRADVIRSQLQAIDATLSGFIRGQTNVCLVMAVYYSVGLTAFGLNSGFGLGILSGLALFIPFVGFAAAFLVTGTIAFIQFGWGTSLIVYIVFFLAGAVLENAVITPKLVGGQVGLHPIWIIFGMLVGATLFGFVGILISLPVTAVIGVLVRFAAKQYINSSLYHGA